MRITGLWPAMVLLSGLLLTSVAAAQSPAPPPSAPIQGPTPDQVARFMEATRATLKHPARAATVRRQEIEVGKRTDGSALLIDVTLPKEGRKAQALPVAILLHGGLPDMVPIKPRAWQVYRDWGTVLADAGAAAIMFDHTLGAPPARLDQALGEIDTVLRWLTGPGAARGLDAKRITVVTFSAGGLLVPALLSESRPARLRSVVMFYPLVGVNAFGGATSLSQPLLDRMSLRNAAPRVAAAGTPLLILRAGKDEIPELLQLLDAAVPALLAADAQLELVNLAGVPHSFDMFSDTPAVRDSIDRALARITAP